MPNTEQQYDDLIGSADSAKLCHVDRATFNRWAAAGDITAAISIPGRTGARLFRRSDVIALAESKKRATAA